MGNSCARSSGDDDNNMNDKCKCSCTATNPFLCTAPPLAVNVAATKMSMQPHHAATVLIHQVSPSSSSLSEGSDRDGSETSLSTPTAAGNNNTLWMSSNHDDDDDAFSTLNISAPVALSVSSVGVNPLNVSFNPQVRILLDSDDDDDADASTRTSKPSTPPCKQTRRTHHLSSSLKNNPLWAPTDEGVVTTRKEIVHKPSEALLSLVPFHCLSISGGCNESPSSSPAVARQDYSRIVAPLAAATILHRNQLAHKRSLEKR